MPNKPNQVDYVRLLAKVDLQLLGQNAFLPPKGRFGPAQQQYEALDGPGLPPGPGDELGKGLALADHPARAGVHLGGGF